MDIVFYEDKYEKAWDRFVLEQSLNGTFLQTRNFLNYHPPGRFTDNSLLFMKGNNIVAALPANLALEEGKKTLYSHQGSTFGGILLGKPFKSIGAAEEIFEKLELYLRENSFDQAIIRMPSSLYTDSNSELLDYFFFVNDYVQSCEIGYYVDFARYDEDIIRNFSASRRRDYKYSLKNDLSFRELEEDGEIAAFYEILCDNYTKFGKKPVHTLEELIEFKRQRLKSVVKFYGVCHEGELAAGCMAFCFGKKVLHTQYLACRQSKTSFFINEALYKNMIQTAKDQGYDKLSFGISTLNGGRVLSRNLAQYKEGYGTVEYVNRTYRKEF